tara:strand:+ start:1320 stop:1421 length:102 start_codon:yes stop_codon:yes gene_type:complete
MLQALQKALEGSTLSIGKAVRSSTGRNGTTRNK